MIRIESYINDKRIAKSKIRSLLESGEYITEIEERRMVKVIMLHKDLIQKIRLSMTATTDGFWLVEAEVDNHCFWLKNLYESTGKLCVLACAIEHLITEQ